MAGAAELVARKDSQYGWLRRQGKLERMMGVKWRQKFVVITGGHMHLFKSDSAKQPQKIYPLSTYNVVKRSDGTVVSNKPWCFALEQKDVGKGHYFSCMSEKCRQDWIGKFKYAMTKAHGKPVSSISDYQTENYAFLEEPIIKEKVTQTRKAQTLPTQQRYIKLPNESDSDSEFSSDDGNIYHQYEDVDKELPSAVNTPLPPTPAEEGDLLYRNVATGAKRETSDVGSRPQITKAEKKIVVTRPNPSKPIAERKKLFEGGKPSLQLPIPDYLNVPEPIASKVALPIKKEVQLQERDYFYDTNDKEAVARLLEKCKEPRTFLVRRSRGSADKVLAVYCGTEIGTKEFKIFQTDGKYHLANKATKACSFDSYEALFACYMKNALPMEKPIIKLKHPYMHVKHSKSDYESPNYQNM